MTPREAATFMRHLAERAGVSPQEFARRFNEASGEQVAQVLERYDTNTLEWAVRFEASGEGGKR